MIKDPNVVLINTIVVSTLFLFPVNLMLTQPPGEFYFTVFDLGAVLLAITSLFVALSTTVFLSLRTLQTTTVTLFLMFFLTAAFSQAYLFVWPYDIVGGQQYSWERFHKFGFLEIITYALLALLFYFFRKSLPNKAMVLSLLMIMTQVGQGVVNYLNADDTVWYQHKTFKNDKIGHFSKEENLLVIVIDTFQGNIVNQILRQRFLDEFEGFTAFTDVFSNYHLTFPSLPSLLTGQAYKNEEPVTNFLTKAYKADSIPKIFKENGYSFEVYSQMSPVTVTGLNIYADNLDPNPNLFLKFKKPNVEKFLTLLQFRLSPHFLKVATFDELSFYKFVGIGEPAHLIDQMEIGLNANANGPVFKLVHISGAHPPFLFDENLDYYESNRPESERFNIQVEGVLNRLVKFFDNMKQAGIYDHTTIVVTADHGSGISAEDSELSEGKQSALTALMIKPAHSETHKLQFNDNAGVLTDLPTTLFEMEGFLHSQDRINIFSESMDRTRWYYFFNLTDRSPPGYIPDLRVYSVDGPSNLATSWKYHFKSLTKDGVVLDTPASLEIGKRYKFGINGIGREFGDPLGFVSGQNHTWTHGRSSTARFKTDVHEDLKVTIKAGPNASMKTLKKQMVKIISKGQHIGTFTVDRFADYSFIIPKQHLDNGVATVTFLTPNSYAGTWFNTTKDHRILGISMLELQIDVAESTKLAKAILNFGQGGNGLKYLRSGYSWPGTEATWLTGDHASLALPERHITGDLTLELTMTPIIAANLNTEKLLTLHINDLCKRTIKLDTWRVYRTKFPKECFNDGPSNLEFEMPFSKSPYNLGLSNDKRELGVSLAKIEMSVGAAAD